MSRKLDEITSISSDGANSSPRRHYLLERALSWTTALKSDAKTLVIEDYQDNFEEKEINLTHVTVQNLVGATLYLNGSPKSLKIDRLTDCKLICGPVHTSVLVKECRNCVLFLCCEQLKVNSCEALDIYLRVRYRAVIADCLNIRFAPYTWQHERSAELHRLCQFNETQERFDQIEDFNWLAFSTQSPNWTVIPEEERVEFPETELPEKEIPLGLVFPDVLLPEENIE